MARVISKPPLLLKLARGGFSLLSKLVFAGQRIDKSLTAPFFYPGTQHAKLRLTPWTKRDSRNLFYSWESPVPSYDSTRIALLSIQICGSFFLLSVRRRYMGNTTLQSIPNILCCPRVT